jgi:5-hydroxyisourate hydrolase
MPSGDYRLTFAVEPYLRRRQAPVFYPEVIVHFRITGNAGRFHLPLLLSPFGYSTYRGS